MLRIAAHDGPNRLSCGRENNRNHRRAEPADGAHGRRRMLCGPQRKTPPRLKRRGPAPMLCSVGGTEEGWGRRDNATGGPVVPRLREQSLTAQLAFNFLAARTNLLACALYGRFRPSRLLGFIAHFVSLPTVLGRAR
jgi:hypothetical protein